MGVSARPIRDAVGRRLRSRVAGPAVAAGLSALVVWLALAGGTLDAATVVGQIREEAGLPVARVTCTLVPQGSGAYAGQGGTTAVSDAEGAFCFESVAPGAYRLTASKPGWVPTEQALRVPEDQAQATLEVNVSLSLTFWSRLVDTIRLGVLAYVMIFGLLALVVNYWVAPEPSREIAVVGWVFILASVTVAAIKMQWTQALMLAAIGPALAALIHKYGSRTAARRIEHVATERQRQETDRQREQDALEQLVGKQGVTLTCLKAYGTASIDGNVLDVRALYGFIPPQTRVVVKKLDGGTPVVDLMDSAS